MFISTHKFIVTDKLVSKYAHQFVYLTQNLSSEIQLTTDRTVNGKSLLGVLSLGIVKGDVLNITVSSRLSQEQADKDLNKVLTFSNGDD